MEYLYFTIIILTHFLLCFIIIIKFIFLTHNIYFLQNRK